MNSCASRRDPSTTIQASNISDILPLEADRLYHMTASSASLARARKCCDTVKDPEVVITSGKAGVPKLDGSLREGREPMEMQKSAAQSGKWVLGLPHLFLVSLSQITPVSTGAQGNIGGISSSRTVICNMSKLFRHPRRSHVSLTEVLRKAMVNNSVGLSYEIDTETSSVKSVS